jgi:hypothetical protein
LKDIFNEENPGADESFVPQFINYTTPVIPELAPDEECKVKGSGRCNKEDLKGK